MTRIVAGKAGGIRLDSPAKGTRPTSEKVREAIFSTLAAWGYTDNVRVLDLYAGTGALGLESASRGATSVVLVEKHPPASRIMQTNITRVKDSCETCDISAHTANVHTFLQGYAGAPFDLVFSDPPYDLPNEQVENDLQALIPHLVSDALVLIERDCRTQEPNWPAEYTLEKTKKYGETTVYWLALALDETQ